MTQPTLVKSGKGRYRLEGDVTFLSVARLADQRLQANSRSCHVALDGLERADSSVLALLLKWLRQAVAAGHELTFSGFSHQLLSLIDLYDLGDLLTESNH
jgi:ABC-type transporter Mla MlaB component